LSDMTYSMSGTGLLRMGAEGWRAGAKGRRLNDWSGGEDFFESEAVKVFTRAWRCMIRC